MSRNVILPLLYVVLLASAGIACMTVVRSTGWVATVGSGFLAGAFMLLASWLTQATMHNPTLRWCLAIALALCGLVVLPIVSALMQLTWSMNIIGPIYVGCLSMLLLSANELPWRSLRRPTGLRNPAPQPTGQCHACRYNLSAQRDAVFCPQCGTVVDRYQAFGTHGPITKAIDA